MATIKVVRAPRPRPLPWWKWLLLWELFKGLWVTFKYQFRALEDPFTVQYPEEKLELKSRFRGFPKLRVDPQTGESACNACQLCEKACPDDCITVVAEKHPSGKGRRAKVFDIDYERCCLCGLCEEACPPKNGLTAIYMSHDFERADFDRGAFRLDRETLHEDHHPEDFARRRGLRRFRGRGKGRWSW
jgi:NADH-quinone oxidoreductase subunit I